MSVCRRLYYGAIPDPECECGAPIDNGEDTLCPDCRGIASPATPNPKGTK